MIRIHVIGMPEPITTDDLDFYDAISELREAGVLEVPFYGRIGQPGAVTAVALPAASVQFIENISDGQL